MTTLTFSVSDSTGRFAVMDNGKIVFESYHLDAKERALLKEVIRILDEQAWAAGHDAAVLLTKEFAARLHIVRADQ